MDADIRRDQRRAAAWLMVSRLWGFAAAPVSLLTVAHTLGRIEQGYIYTFTALVAASVLVELGLGQVLITISSHHRQRISGFSRDGVHGDEAAIDHLGWLLRRATAWIATGIPLFVITVGALGAWVLGSHDEGVHWQGPWAATVLLAVPSLLLSPALALMEGCGMVAQIARLRLAQAVLPALAMWLGLWAGCGLWSTTIAGSVQFLLTVGFLLHHRRLFAALWRRSPPAAARWSQEVWPLQWRFGISWLCGWLISQCLVPLVLRLDGPVAAGQLGMSLSLAWALIGVASVWINAVTPELGRLAAGREWAAMDRAWSRAMAIGGAVAVAGGACAFAGLLGLHAWWPSLAERFLPPVLLAWVLAFALCHVLISGVAVHLRAHRSEPFMTLSIAEGLAIVTFATLAGMRFGVAGVVVAQAMVHLTLGIAGAALLRRRLLPVLRQTAA